ncbi:MAG TPA: hypothetical protein VNA11_02355 [Pseudonocardia sp.]|jgi:hypothetical protein|nr:hypothetical protein [Pseudonocardia sp.]
MSTTNSSGPAEASSSALIESAFDADGVQAIDSRIVALRERIRATSPRFAKLVPGYWDEIDHLLELRFWLTGALRA